MSSRVLVSSEGQLMLFGSNNQLFECMVQCKCCIHGWKAYIILYNKIICRVLSYKAPIDLLGMQGHTSRPQTTVFYSYLALGV